MKIILDTNVWVSSLLKPNSIPGQITAAWKQNQLVIITSQPILEEIRNVLAYPKIQKRLCMLPQEIDEFLSFIYFFTEYIEIKAHTNHSRLRDHKDLPILNTLLNTHADYLVTGDKDLLVLSDSYPIITPGEFAEFL